MFDLDLGPYHLRQWQLILNNQIQSQLIMLLSRGDEFYRMCETIMMNLVYFMEERKAITKLNVTSPSE